MAKLTMKGVQLDKKDEALLWLLTKNCRLPLKDLASKTGLTVDSVFRRMKFYESNGIVDKYTADLKLKYLGLNLVSYVTLRLKNVSEKDFKELLDFLLTYQNVAEVSTTMGAFDLFFVLMAKDANDFEAVSNRIRHKFSNMIDEWESIPVLKTYKYNYVEVREPGNKIVKVKKNQTKSEESV